MEEASITPKVLLTPLKNQLNLDYVTSLLILRKKLKIQMFKNLQICTITMEVISLK